MDTSSCVAKKNLARVPSLEAQSVIQFPNRARQSRCGASTTPKDGQPPSGRKREHQLSTSTMTMKTTKPPTHQQSRLANDTCQYTLQRPMMILGCLCWSVFPVCLHKLLVSLSTRESVVIVVQLFLVTCSVRFFCFVRIVAAVDTSPNVLISWRRNHLIHIHLIDHVRLSVVKC